MLWLLFLCLLPIQANAALAGCSTHGNVGNSSHMIDYILVRFDSAISFSNYSHDLMSVAFRVTTPDSVQRSFIISNVTLFNSTTLRIDLEKRATALLSSAATADESMYPGVGAVPNFNDFGGIVTIYRYDLESQTGQTFNVTYGNVPLFVAGGLQESGQTITSMSCTTRDLSPPALSRVFSVTGGTNVYFQFSEPIKPTGAALGISNFTLSLALSFSSTTLTPVDLKNGYAQLWTINSNSVNAVSQTSTLVVTPKAGIAVDRSENAIASQFSARTIKLTAFDLSAVPYTGLQTYSFNSATDIAVSLGLCSAYDLNEDGVFDTIKVSLPFVFNTSSVNVTSLKLRNFYSTGSEISLAKTLAQDEISDSILLSMSTSSATVGTRTHFGGSPTYSQYPQLTFTGLTTSFYSLVNSSIFVSSKSHIATDACALILDQARIVAVSATGSLGGMNVTVVFSETLTLVTTLTLYTKDCSTTFTQVSTVAGATSYTFNATSPLTIRDFLNCKFAFETRPAPLPTTGTPDGLAFSRVPYHVNPTQRVAWKPITVKSSKTAAPTLLKAEVFSDNTTTWTYLILTFSEAIFSEILPTVQATATKKTVTLSSPAFLSSTQLRYNVTVNCTVSGVECFATDDSLSLTVSGARDLHANLMTSFSGAPLDKSLPVVRAIAISDQFLIVLLSEKCNGTLDDATFSLNDTSNTALDITWFDDVAVIAFSKAIESIVVDQVRFFDLSGNLAHYPKKFSASKASNAGTTIIIVDGGDDNNGTDTTVTITAECNSLGCLSVGMLALVIVLSVIVGVGVLSLVISYLFKAGGVKYMSI